jgi:hypothetical protein
MPHKPPIPLQAACLRHKPELGWRWNSKIKALLFRPLLFFCFNPYFYTRQPPPNKTPAVYSIVKNSQGIEYDYLEISCGFPDGSGQCVQWDNSLGNLAA